MILISLTNPKLIVCGRAASIYSILFCKVFNDFWDEIQFQSDRTHFNLSSKNFHLLDGGGEKDLIQMNTLSLVYSSCMIGYKRKLGMKLNLKIN